MERLIRAIQNISLFLNVNANDITIYERSYNKVGMCQLMMFKIEGNKRIIIAGQGRLFDELAGEVILTCKICPLSHENRLVLNKYLDFTNPKAFGPNVATFGLGDRLGITSAAHIKALLNCGIKPILAQQSKRELALTNRNYDEIIDCACYAVIQEGYKEGFGADGDHLKYENDIAASIASGASMITLDCADLIDNSIDDLNETELEARYMQLSDSVRDYYERNYLGQKIVIDQLNIAITPKSLMKELLIYADSIEFIEHIYQNEILKADRKIDFEISLDETLKSTTLLGHYLVASEMAKRKIEVSSLAPRFVGEFQKGIDYIGNTVEFEADFKAHAMLADRFGYKISVHSGSDKFSIFSMVGKHTQGRFHVKTSGTNWLEAVRVIAKVNPDLYRRMHLFALDHFRECQAYYHVTTDLAAIADINEVVDRCLPDYLNENNARQLMHITYGPILNATEAGKSQFRDEIYSTLANYESQFEESVVTHILRHVRLLVETPVATQVGHPLSQINL
ncbi:MAG: tagaturonate epimerase family protein [Eubacteriales bacterium]|nr:tagaturonate epimerase family protein [Eubacteriales bacterium]